MLVYNLSIEYISLIIILIVILSFIWNKEIPSLQYRVFQCIYFGTFFSIVATITTTITSRHFTKLPLWLLEANKTIYFLLVPIVTVCLFFYSVVITQTSTTKKNIDKRWYLTAIPYGIYIIFVLSNYIFHHIFYFSPIVGYSRGPFFEITYVIAIIYFIGIILIAFLTRKTSKRNISLILFINVLLAVAVSIYQFFNKTTLVAGFASLSGTLISFLYVQTSNATTDKLTNVLNRQSLMYHMYRKSKIKQNFSLFVYSIQNFKVINERFGLTIGDATIERIAQILQSQFPKNKVFRYSGDEFAILAPTVDERFEKRIDEAYTILSNGIPVHERNLKLSFVYTRVDYPEFSKNIKTLISTADYAISLLKEKSYKNNFLYDNSISKIMQYDTKIIDVLKSSLEHNYFEVYYQPIYSSEKGTFTQCEALIRLSGEYYNKYFPNDFIPVAEKTGIIVEMTYVIIEKVCKDFRYLIDTYGDSLEISSISINFPYKIFYQSNLLERTVSILEQYAISPSQIKIEITERSLISDEDIVKNAIEKMQNKGFLFELDDFGVEYSNMSVLLRLPINILKIDKSLLTISIETEQRRIFFSNLIKGIHAIGINVIVEGVENNEQLDFIQSCGCEYVQGYVFSKPLPLQDFIEFIKKNS